METPKNMPQNLTTTSRSSSIRRSTDSPSPEFEFWMTRNPSLPQPDLLSADQLFVDGVLRSSVHTHKPPDPPNPTPQNPPNKPHTDPDQSGSGHTGLCETPTVSKRWTDIFKKTKTQEKENNSKKKKVKKGGGINGVTTAELNINIWPFFRSRSAGSGGNRHRTTAAAGAPHRKVSSAPCSRSNSAGESKSRKWPSSPSRGGVHLGRSSPVWQVRRVAAAGKVTDGGFRNNGEKGVRKYMNEVCRRKAVSGAATNGGTGGGGGGKGKVENVSVPTCIGYRSHLSCRSDEVVVVGGGSGGAAAGNTSGGGVPAGNSGGGGVCNGDRGNNNNNSNLFNLRSLFTKKVVY